MRVILTTVGASLLGNAERTLGAPAFSDADLANYLARQPPVAACAETNSLGRLLGEGDAIVLIHSNTDEGKRCAEALRRHFAGNGYATEAVEISDLNYTESRFKLRGLRALVAELARRIARARARGDTVVINATGGFKAEIAYATLVGLLFDVPVYYIHELFHDLIEMPAVPIGWDYAIFAEWDEFFDWIDEEPRRTADVEQRWPSLPHEVRVLLAEDDDCTYLSPAGDAFIHAYEYVLARSAGIPVYLSEAARQSYQRAEVSVQTLWQRTVAKLRSPELRLSHSDRVGGSDCLAFPKGHRNERVFWYEENGTVFVCELSRHSDESYERLIAHGVQRRQYPRNSFAVWQP